MEKEEHSFVSCGNERNQHRTNECVAGILPEYLMLLRSTTIDENGLYWCQPCQANQVERQVSVKNLIPNLTQVAVWYHHLSLPAGKHVGEVLLSQAAPWQGIRGKRSHAQEKNMHAVYERCCGSDVHKILPNRNHLSLMISQSPCVLMLFRHLSVV